MIAKRRELNRRPEQGGLNGLNLPTDRALKVKECASALGVTSEQIIHLIEAGKLQAINCATSTSGRSSYRIPPCAWRKFLQRRDTLLHP